MPVVLFLLLWGAAEATTLVSKYQFLTGNNLPQGVWTFGYSRGAYENRGSYGNRGQKISNSEYFSRNLTYSNVLDEIKDPIDRDLAGAAFSAYERDHGAHAGRVVNDVSVVSQKSDTYILGRGLSERSSLFMVFPVVNLETKFTSRFLPSDSLSGLATELMNEGQYLRAQEILNRTEGVLRDRLDENGYNTTYPTRLTTLANIYTNFRYEAYRKNKLKLQSDSFLIIPAGKKFSDADFVPLRFNEEQLSLKQGLTGEWNPTIWTGFLTSLYYHKRFSHRRASRVPANSVNPLSIDRDPDTKVQYGDAYGVSAQANLVAKETLSFYVGQVLEYKLRDQYSGNKFTSERYDHLEKNTEQKLGTGYVGVNLNTIPAFLAGKLWVPMDLNVQYAVTNLGQNIFRTRTISLNMMMFYK